MTHAVRRAACARIHRPGLDIPSRSRTGRRTGLCHLQACAILLLSAPQATRHVSEARRRCVFSPFLTAPISPYQQGLLC